jgi:hypothetical protein
VTDQIEFVFFGVSVKDWEIWHIGDKRWFSLSLVPQALGCLRLLSHQRTASNSLQGASCACQGCGLTEPWQFKLGIAQQEKITRKNFGGLRPPNPRFLLLKIFIRSIEEKKFPSGEFGEKGFCILQSRANGRFHLP